MRLDTYIQVAFPGPRHETEDRRSLLVSTRRLTTKLFAINIAQCERGGGRG
jgi:hypothetical protein